MGLVSRMASLLAERLVAPSRHRGSALSNLKPEPKEKTNISKPVSAI